MSLDRGRNGKRDGGLLGHQPLGGRRNGRAGRQTGCGPGPVTDVG